MRRSVLLFALVGTTPHASALVAWQRAVAGASAYCVATLISSPIDVVKTRVQVGQDQDCQGNAATSLQVARTMLLKEGLLAFFAGIGPALLCAPAAVVQYTLMDPLRETMPLFVAAIIAGSLDITIKCPFDRLKTQLQASSGTGSGPGTFAILASTLRDRGIAGVWAGYGATLSRDIPYLVLKWLTYTTMQATLAPLLATPALSWLFGARNLIAGGVAGAVAATAVTPVDVIKTRLQAGVDKTDNKLAIARKVVQEGGIPALFSGLGPRLARIPLYTAVTLATFDFVKDCFIASDTAGMMNDEL